MPCPAPFITVLEDEPSMRLALERLLCSEGYRVTAYADAAKFLVHVPTDRPDVLLLDLRMPEMDGFDVMQALKQVGVKLPIIVLTAEYSSLVRDRAIAEGALAYLIKPVNDQDLFDALSMALVHSKLPPNA